MPVSGIPFTSWPFKATGTPTARSMPTRLAEIKNVLDFGADPTGGNPSATTAAIQSAVNWTSGPNRGIIKFPTGAYQLNAPITYNYDGDLSICFRGEHGVNIFGNFNGYLFDRHLATPNNTTGGRVFEKLTLQNGHATGGCVRMGSTAGGVFRDCQFGGNVCITTEDSPGNSSESILIQDCTFVGVGGGYLSANPGNGIIIGGAGAVMGCDFAGCDVGLRVYGTGFSVTGSRCERCNTGYLFGLDSADNDVGAFGWSLTAQSFEGNGTAVDLAGTNAGFYIGQSGAQGHDSDNSGYQGSGSAPPGSQYGYRLRAGKCSAGVLINLNTGSFYEVAGISIGNASSRANIAVMACGPTVGGGAGVAWELPTNAFTAGFKLCNTQPIWTFSQLPTGGNVLEGDEFDISDSTTNTWGANVTTGGGSNRTLVRYNGTNYTVVGK